MAFSRSGMTFLDYPLKLNISQSVVQPGTCFMFGWVRASVGDSNANIALMRLVTIELGKNKPGIYIEVYQTTPKSVRSHFLSPKASLCCV